MKTGRIKQAFKSERFRAVRKVVVTIAGTVVLLIGILLLFIPGPAFVVIPAGFGILAIEFDWARRWMQKTVACLKYYSSPRNLKQLLYENSLTAVLLGLFLVCLAGQMLAGHRSYNSERRRHGELELSLKRYLTSGHAIEATFENWESEFLQMGTLVLLTVYLRQKGAVDSQELSAARRGNRSIRNSAAPWPARQGGWIRKFYAHSLSSALLALFLLSLALHAAGGRNVYNENQIRQGGPTVSVIQYAGTADFWFQSFQNWQSEFLSVGVLLLFSIFLRERGSPQSKPVDAPCFETGAQ
jgi:uncharacterized protein (TIGR02611 family)